MPIPLGILAVAGAGAGGIAAFDLLETVLVSSNTNPVTFSNLNNYSDYKHLQLRITGRNSDSISYSVLEAYLRFNGDTGSNYARHFLFGTGSSVISDNQTSRTSAAIGYTSGNDATGNAFAGNVVDILDPFSTTKNKTVRTFAGLQTLSSSLGPASSVALMSSVWLSTSAVTSIDVYAGFGGNPNGNFRSGSRISLYGIK